MDNQPVPPAAHNPAGDPPVPQPEEIVTLTKKEHDDLKRKADVSSQNYERLQKEKERTAELETRLTELLENPNPSGLDSEEIGKIRNQLADLQTKQAKSEVLEAHPELKEVWQDFEKFRDDPENKGMNMRTAAKAFLTEKGLNTQPRPGLEPAGGGPRTPQPAGMSAEEIKKLRETDYKKYSDLVRKGLIKVPD